MQRHCPEYNYTTSTRTHSPPAPNYKLHAESRTNPLWRTPRFSEESVSTLNFWGLWMTSYWQELTPPNLTLFKNGQTGGRASLAAEWNMPTLPSIHYLYPVIPSIFSHRCQLEPVPASGERQTYNLNRLDRLPVYHRVKNRKTTTNTHTPMSNQG